MTTDCPNCRETAITKKKRPAKKRPAITHLSSVDVAHMLSTSKQTVYRLRDSGELPATRVRGQWRYSIAGVNAYIERNSI